MFVRWLGLGPQKCSLCDKMPKTETTMRVHLRNVHKVDATVGKAPLAKKLMIPDEGQGKNVCPRCRVQFGESSSLRQHYQRGACLRTASPPKDPVCRYCGSTIERKKFEGHVRSGECGKKQAAAPRCPALSKGGKQCIRKMPCDIHPTEHVQCGKCGESMKSLFNHRCKVTVEKNYVEQFAWAPPEEAGPGEPQPSSLSIYGETVEMVKEFRYLGRVVAENDKDGPDIQARLQGARATVARLKHNVFGAAGVTAKTKVTVFRTVCTAQLKYGCESWRVTRRDEGKLRAFQQRCLRQATRTLPTITTDDDGQKRIRMPSRELVLERAGMGDLVREIDHSQLRYYGHVLRMEEESEVRKSFLSSMMGKGAPGFSNEALVATQMKRKMEACGLSQKDAKDREQWRQKIQRTKTEDVRKGEAPRERARNKCGAATLKGGSCQQHLPCRHHPRPPPPG